MAVSELSPSEIKQLQGTNNEIVLLDVREQWEFDLVHLPGAQLTPLSRFMQILPQLDSEKEYIIYCHHGARSMQVCLFLDSKGFKSLINMAGGIEQYAIEVDQTLPRY